MHRSVAGEFALSLAGGLWSPDDPLEFVGNQNSFKGGLVYTAQIEVPTHLRSVIYATAQVSLASISNRKSAVNAAWRIHNYSTHVDTPNPGDVRISVTIQVHDNDGYLERLSFGVQALGIGNLNNRISRVTFNRDTQEVVRQDVLISKTLEENVPRVSVDGEPFEIP